MAYELVGAGCVADFPVIDGGAKPGLPKRMEQRDAMGARLMVCGLNSNGRLFFELASIHDISSSGCRMHLCTKPQCDSPLAVRMPSEHSGSSQESAQLLFQVVWMVPETEGWAIGARSMGSADLRALVFPAKKT